MLSIGGVLDIDDSRTVTVLVGMTFDINSNNICDVGRDILETIGDEFTGALSAWDLGVVGEKVVGSNKAVIDTIYGGRNARDRKGTSNNNRAIRINCNSNVTPSNGGRAWDRKEDWDSGNVVGSNIGVAN